MLARHQPLIDAIAMEQMHARQTAGKSELSEMRTETAHVDELLPNVIINLEL